MRNKSCYKSFIFLIFLAITFSLFSCQKDPGIKTGISFASEYEKVTGGWGRDVSDLFSDEEVEADKTDSDILSTDFSLISSNENNDNSEVFDNEDVFTQEEFHSESDVTTDTPQDEAEDFVSEVVFSSVNDDTVINEEQDVRTPEQSTVEKEPNNPTKKNDVGKVVVTENADKNDDAHSDPPAAETKKTEKIITYIYNKNTKKFHFESCGSASQIKEKNKGTSTDRADLISSGYQPCKRCNP